MATVIIAPAIINNEQIQQIPKDLLDILNLTLDDFKKELGKKE
jgi:hypothetical protein